MIKMKLLLLHGSARIASRYKLLEIKQKFDQNNVVVFEEGADILDIKNNLSATSFFLQERLVILENPEEGFQSSAFSLQSNITLIIWFDKALPEKNKLLNFVKDAGGQVLFFPEGREVSVFLFLDLLANKDSRAFLELAKLKNANFEIQYFITMVFYLLRNLVATPKNAPPFVREKLERQRKNFNLEKIKNLYKNILEIDFKIKSGLLDVTQAEFLLVGRFVHFPPD